jgi:prepilin signal peptidase PulO-like enzyme (type II secretory pathway)
VSATEQPSSSLLGRARAAGARAWWRTPLDVATLALAALCVVRYGFSGQGLLAIYIVVVLAVLTAIDVEEGLLPNRIVFPSIAVVFFARLAMAPDRALEWILAGVGAAAFLLLPLLAYRNGMGLGDVKLAFLLGLALGKLVVFALFVACIGAAAYAIFLLVRHGSEGRTKTFAFGPFLALGGVLALLLGAPTIVG